MHRWAVVLLLYSGCAFGLTGPDPDLPRSKVPQCDTGKGLVALDGVIAATAGIVAIGLAGENEPSIALVPLAIGSIYLGGAIRGNSTVNKCRKAIGEYESYVASLETAPAAKPDDEMPEPPRRPPLTARAEQPTPTPVPPPSPAPVVVPTPAPAAAPAPKAAAKPAPAPAEKDDEWSEFWREVD
jgi:hypothetical protein